MPGWIAVGLGALAAVHWLGISRAVAAGGVLLWIVKDLALYPLLRIAYRTDSPSMDRVVGASARADGPLTPEGTVCVGAERWRAELVGPTRQVPAGAPLQVVEVRDLMLRVVPAPQIGAEEPAGDAAGAPGARRSAPGPGAADREEDPCEPRDR